MAFGLTHWLISFAIFLTILTIVTWSAVHLGKRGQNSTDITLRFLDDRSVEWENEPFTIVRNSIPRVVESTDGPALFANDQGSEIPDSAQFYEILQRYSTKSSAVNSANYDTATVILASSTVGNDSTWSDDTTTTLYNTSDRTSALDNHQNASEEVTRLPDYISQTVHPASTHGAKSFDMNKSDSNRTVGTELFEFLQEKRNGTSNASVTLSFMRPLSSANATAIEQTTTIRTTLNGESEAWIEIPIN